MAWMHCLWLLVFSIGCTQTHSLKKVNKTKLAQSRVNLGLAYLENKQWQKARFHLEKAVEVAPKNVQARMGFAYYLQQVGEDEEAKQQYAIALTFAPNEPNLLNNYGVFLCQIGKYDKAEKALLSAIKQKGYYKLSTSYENAGLCAMKFKHFAKAKSWFEKALSHEPNRLLSTLYLSKIGMKEGKFSEARKYLISFHKHNGYQASTLLAMIKLEKAENQTKKIKKYVQLLAEQFPHSPEYRQYLDNEF